MNTSSFSSRPGQGEGAPGASAAVAWDPVQSRWVSWPPDAGGPGLLTRSAIALRPWALADAAVYHALLSEPALWRWMPEEMPRPFTRSVAETLIEIARHGNHHHVSAITEDGVPVGQVRCLLPTTDEPDCAEVSYWIGRPHWGRGIASSALARFLGTCRRQFPFLRSFEARIHQENRASRRVVEKLGFRLDERRAAPQVLRYLRAA